MASEQILFQIRLAGRRAAVADAAAVKAAVKDMGDSTDRAGRKGAAGLGKLDRQMGDVQRSARRQGSAMAGYAKAAAGFAGLAGLGSVVKTAGNYDTALREVGAVSRASAKELQTLGALSRDAGLQTGVGAVEATKAMGELAKAGLSTAQIGPALNGTLMLAQAGSLGTAEAAKAATDAMNAFGLKAGQAGSVADAFANAANATNADVGDFAYALSQGGAAAAQVKMPFEDTITVLTQLAKIGVTGSDAGTSLKTAFLQLLDPTEKASGAMKRYGLEFFKANGEVKSAADISEMLNKNLGKLNPEQQSTVLKTIAGTDGFRTFAAMMKYTGKQTRSLSGELTRQGSAAEVAKKKQAGIKGSMDRLKASGQELSIAIGTPLAEALADAADGVTKLVKQAEKDGTLKELSSTVKDMTQVGKDAVQWLLKMGKAHPELVKVAGAILGIGLALKALKFLTVVTGLRGLARTGLGAAKLSGRLLGRALGTQLGATGAAASARTLTGSGRITQRALGRMGPIGRVLGRALGIPMGTQAATNAASDLTRSGRITGKAGGRMGSIGRSLGKLLGRGIGGAAVITLAPLIANGIEDALTNAFGANTPGKQEALDNLRRNPLQGSKDSGGGPWNKLKDAWDNSPLQNIPGVPGGRKGGGPSRGRAVGGIVRPGETTLVGERGPELLRAPWGSKVETATSPWTRGAMGRGISRPNAGGMMGGTVSQGGPVYLTPVRVQLDSGVLYEAISRQTEIRSAAM